MKWATIMIVDDEPTMIEILQTFLEEAGYENFVTTTESGPALSLLPKTMPDVVLLDVMMPGITGLEILSWIRSHEALKHTPVIILTSATDPETKLKALELGATDFLAKPVDASELALRLRNTLAAKAHQDRLVNYDGVTGLPNRRLFMKRFAQDIQDSQGQSTQCALLRVNLDRFKQINDTLGHRFGDALLRAVAHLLEECFRESDMASLAGMEEGEGQPVSRVGGDEFAVVLPKIARLEDATVVVRRLVSVLGKPLHLQGRELSVTASIGTAVYPADGENADVLFKHAGVAMSQAKQRGGNTYQYYSKEFNARAVQRLKLENRLRRAIDGHELALRFQPKLDVKTGRVTGGEALLRWKHPKLGMILPGKFIPIAEESGLIVPFDEWVLYSACAVSQRWQALQKGSARISVNVSAQHFRNADRLLLTIRHALESNGLDGECLCLELTESVVMEDPEDNVRTLGEIKRMGVKISIDDFGTGYSSLSYLRRFPLDELKVDRSFLHEIPNNVDDAAIVDAIIAMAHSLGLCVVAEGVETEEQLEFLRERGCDEFQGFLVSEPVPARDFLALVSKGE
ncbi:MAG: EAL domain-containing protein [Gammaproteobacteria bacterium]|nr:EAL domain-containing protein [Gammaproteobacteria bacterium]NIR83109.1 EAL domain-containing protein [Gammaproteobacteria bacterium]NIR90771.1 EAL domain-containing protein [Gammaproteobacteria bacterium]NIU04262.1 EAL domain-containing protein [Gammaproteobacteria bacterium]NIV51554.1 EAL domain-containing protein [Gammaproteobacteria bacterium]